MIPPPPELQWQAEFEIDSSSDHGKRSAEEVSMLFELRIYGTRPGQRASWVKFFEEELVPYALSKRVVVVGSFTAEQDQDQFVWIRRFDSEDYRVHAYAAVYDRHARRGVPDGIACRHDLAVVQGARRSVLQTGNSRSSPRRLAAPVRISGRATPRAKPSVGTRARPCRCGEQTVAAGTACSWWICAGRMLPAT